MLKSHIQWILNQQDGLETVANGSSWPIQLLQDTFTDLRFGDVALILYKDIPGNKANFKRLQFRFWHFCLNGDHISQAQSNHVFFSQEKSGPNQANWTERASKRCNMFWFFIARVPFFLREKMSRCIQLLANNWHSNFGCGHVPRLNLFFCSFSTAGVYEDNHKTQKIRGIYEHCVSPCTFAHSTYNS